MIEDSEYPLKISFKKLKIYFFNNLSLKLNDHTYQRDTISNKKSKVLISLISHKQNSHTWTMKKVLRFLFYSHPLSRTKINTYLDHEKIILKFKDFSYIT